MTLGRHLDCQNASSNQHLMGNWIGMSNVGLRTLLLRRLERDSANVSTPLEIGIEMGPTWALNLGPPG